MTPEVAQVLRQPFPRESVGKLPRVWCARCRDSQGRVCADHQRARCRECGNNITIAHLHLDYVGHAEVTDRLLQADPQWTWEPVAFDNSGLPMRDQLGGLWIRLTVAGVTRLGYGHADGKTSPDAVKEAIGDALRNAAMRFGVAVDMWGATFKDEYHDAEPDHHDESGSARPVRPAAETKPAPKNPGNDPQRRRMYALLGQAELTDRDAKLAYVIDVIGHPVATSNDLTDAEVQAVCDRLTKYIAQTEPAEATT